MDFLETSISQKSLISEIVIARDLSLDLFRLLCF